MTLKATITQDEESSEVSRLPDGPQSAGKRKAVEDLLPPPRNPKRFRRDKEQED